MRWTKREKRKWDVGEQRVKKKFLIRPRCLPQNMHSEDKQWRWLERAEIIQELSYKRYVPLLSALGLFRNVWKNKQWGSW